MASLIFVLFVLVIIFTVVALSDESEDDDYIIYNRKDEL